MRPQPELWLTLTVRHREGSVERRHQRARSFLLQYAQHIRHAFAFQPSTVENVKDITGVDRGIQYAQHGPGTRYWLYVGGPALGVLLGSDGTAVAMTDFKLGAEIGDGAGPGQLTRVSWDTPAIYGSDPDRFLEVNKVFRNVSGAQVTIAEAAMYADTGNAAPYYTFCVIRDTLSPPVLMEPLAIIMATYTIRITTS